MNRKKVIRIILALIAMAAISCVSVYLVNLDSYKTAVKSITIEEVDLGTISDGDYIGSADVSFVSAEVSVSVRDHKITDIRILKHDNGRGGPAEAIVPEMIREQRIDVDEVSGATSSCKVIKQACVNALTGGK